MHLGVEGGMHLEGASTIGASLVEVLRCGITIDQGGWLLYSPNNL
jgi:hypothetical protein